MRGLVRFGVIALAIVATSDDAFSCHRFSRWYYPFAQRCPVSVRTKGGDAHARHKVEKAPVVRLGMPDQHSPAAGAWPKLDGEFDNNAGGDFAIRLRLLGEFR